jgi:hypothetical protein
MDLNTLILEDDSKKNSFNVSKIPNETLDIIDNFIDIKNTNSE